MSLSAREKQRFFLQLAQLLRSGAALPVAVEKLVQVSGGPIRAAARALRRQLERGATAEEALAGLRPALGPMERNCLAASARSGRLDYTLQRLADYFGVLHRARGEIIQRSAYPIFILHLGILLQGLPALLGEHGGLQAYLRAVVPIFLWMYAGLVVFAVLAPIVADLAAGLAPLDFALRLFPFLGKIRRDLSLGRFFGTYDMQLDAGVNVMDSLVAAAGASRSGLLHAAVKHALPELREGGSVASLLQRTPGAVPRDALATLIVAEDTGELHRTLPQLQEEFEHDGLARLRTATEWLPRLLYCAIMVIMGWQIVSFYLETVIRPVQRLLDAP